MFHNTVIWFKCFHPSIFLEIPLKKFSLGLQSSVEEVCVTVEQQFTRLQTAMEAAKKGVVEVLEGEQRQALRQAEGIQAHLEQRITELAKAQAQMNKLCRNKSNINFLQVQNI